VELRDEFDVEAAPEAVWNLLTDVPRVAPLMPGAEITEAVDDRTWKGRVKVKLGPVQLTFAGTITLEQRDDAQHRAVLAVRASEARGKGIAQAMVHSAVTPLSTGSHVEILTDLRLSGAVAQYGAGLLADLSKHMTQQFAQNLAALLRGQAAAGDAMSGFQVARVLAGSALRRVRGGESEA
jgi:carbon monoxide dehydrogenase subunit G